MYFELIISFSPLSQVPVNLRQHAAICVLPRGGRVNLPARVQDQRAEASVPARPIHAQSTEHEEPAQPEGAADAGLGQGEQARVSLFLA